MVLTMRNNPAPLAVQRKATEEEGCGSTSVEFPVIMQDHGQPANDVPRGWRRKWGFSPKVSRFAKIKRASRAASQMKSWVQLKKKKKGDSKQDNRGEASKTEHKARTLSAAERR